MTDLLVSFAYWTLTPSWPGILNLWLNKKLVLRDCSGELRKIVFCWLLNGWQIDFWMPIYRLGYELKSKRFFAILYSVGQLRFQINLIVIRKIFNQLTTFCLTKPVNPRMTLLPKTSLTSKIDSTRRLIKVKTGFWKQTLCNQFMIGGYFRKKYEKNVLIWKSSKNHITNLAINLQFKKSWSGSRKVFAKHQKVGRAWTLSD